MQQLEYKEPIGLLVATSNLERRLAPTLARGFDLVLEFAAPSAAEQSRFAAAMAKA